MSHPFSAHRQSRVEHSRVGHITKGYASGGRVSEAEHKDEKQDRKLIKKVINERDAKAVEGSKAKERLDRPGRARGGRSPKHGKGNNVNVIVAPSHGASPPGGAPPPMAAGPGAGLGAPPMPAPRPPMMAGPPGGLPPGGPPGAGMPPPGMIPPGGPPIRARGGRAYAKGGAVKSGPGWTESEKNKTPVQHAPGKDDQADVGRGKAITYATGGPVEAPGGKKGMGPKIGAGGHSGLGRLRKAHMAEKKGGMAP